MEIYINTNNCVLQRNASLLPTITEIDLIINNFLKLRNDIANIDIDKHNEHKINELYKNNPLTKKIKEIKKGYIYLIKQGNYYKIGKTINITNRIKKYITENPEQIQLIHYYKVKDYTSEEKRLHNMFINKNYNREWFLLDNDDVYYITNLKNEI